MGVIEGDITGQIDAEKIAALGIPAVQLNTDGACHIEAMSIQHILPQFDLDALDVLFVENIGNLVCPAEFNIGEDFRLTILSVPEGDDKVAKYPLMFTDTDCLAISKGDMLPYFDFDLDRVQADYRGVNPEGSGCLCRRAEKRCAAPGSGGNGRTVSLGRACRIPGFFHPGQSAQ